MKKKYTIKEIIQIVTFGLSIILIAIILMRNHHSIIKIIGFILLLLGILVFYASFIYEDVSEKEKLLNIKKRENVINKIGGTKNIEINLSEYDDRNQLIVLKNRSILVGYNIFETEKIINFDDIINVDININNTTEESLGGYTHYHTNYIESVLVYIHTNECTEELIFKYPFYKKNQEKYSEILNKLNRFKTILEYSLNINDSKEKSIPEQIKEYKELLDIGAITESEYDTKKKELLSK